MAAKPSFITYPLLALCFLTMVLGAIAVTIVLALIPIYLPSAKPTLASKYSSSQRYTMSQTISGTVPIGDLDEVSKSKLVAAAKTAFSTADGDNIDLKVDSATISEPTDGGKRKRHLGGSHKLTATFIIYGRNLNFITAFIKKLESYIQVNSAIFIDAVKDFTTTTVATTLSPSVVSTTPLPVSTAAPGRRRRQYNAEATPSSPLVTYRD